MASLKGKKALVFGVANQRSIATSISELLHQEGCRIAAGYLDDGKGRARKRVETACERFSPEFLEPCDLNQDEEVESFFGKLENHFDSLDLLVHSVAFAPLEDIRCPVSEVSRDGFLKAMESSVYSFIKSVKEAASLMEDGGSIVTLSYFGAEKVVPGYNLMGLCKSALESAVRYLAAELGHRRIRVNAISAGALKTLASSAIPHFQTMLASQEKLCPLSEKLLPEDVAKTAVFLLGDDSLRLTGEVLHVDAGYNIMGASLL